MKTIPSLFIWINCVFFIFSSALAQDREEIVVEAEGTYLMGDRDSKQTARELALFEAKRMALEKAGTVLASSTRVENYEVVKDEILSRAAGQLKVEVLEEKWEHCDATMRVRIRIRARVKPQYLEVGLDKDQSLTSSTQILSPSLPSNSYQKQPSPGSLPDHIDPGKLIAEIYRLIRQRQYHPAMQKIKKMQTIYPNLARLYLLEAKIHHETHKERAAIIALRRACSLGSKWACERLRKLQQTSRSIHSQIMGIRHDHTNLHYRRKPRMPLR